MYLVFGGECYYAKGGVNDLKGKFDLFADATQCVRDGTAEGRKWHAWDWFQIVNGNTGELVTKSHVQAHGNN